MTFQIGLQEAGAMDYLITRKIYEILLGNYKKENLKYLEDISKRKNS